METPHKIIPEIIFKIKWQGNLLKWFGKGVSTVLSGYRDGYRRGICEVGNKTLSVVLLYKSRVLTQRIEAKYFYSDLNLKKRSLYLSYDEKRNYSFVFRLTKCGKGD